MHTSNSHLNEKKIFRLVPEINEENLIKLCNDILHNKLKMHSRYPLVVLEKDIWIMDKFDRSWRFSLHSLSYLEHLLDAYKLTSEDKYLKKCLFFVFNWKKNNYPNSLADMAWHDHCTALRLISLCKVYEVCRINNWEHCDQNEFEALIQLHSNKLADASFYMEKHNHGMDQDIALITANTVVTNLKESELKVQLGMDRFNAQIKHLFAPDGSYFEHSPDYINMLAIRLFGFMDFAVNNDIDGVNYLKSVLKKAMRFLAYILQPDGSIPAIGDSVTYCLDVSEYKTSSFEVLKEVEFVTSNGSKGERPGELDIVFPDGGYALMRNSWIYNSRTVQAVFFSSFHSRVHKHHDDLSINIFGHEHPLLVDAGKYNYVYDSKERKYVVSTKAHNTVEVDGVNTITSRNNIGKSGLTSYYLEENLSFVSGIHFLYPGVSHQRAILFLKPNVFLVIDKLNGFKKDHSFEQNFHFNTSISCELNNDEVYGYHQNKPVILLRQINKSMTTKMSLQKGVKEDMKGWISKSYSEIQPTFCLTSKQKGECAEYVTYIDLEPCVKKDVKVDWKDDILDIYVEKLKYTIIFSNDKLHFLVEDDFKKSNYINSTNFKDLMTEKNEYYIKEKYRAERKRRIDSENNLTKLKEDLIGFLKDDIKL